MMMALAPFARGATRATIRVIVVMVVSATYVPTQAGATMICARRIVRRGATPPLARGLPVGARVRTTTSTSRHDGGVGGVSLGVAPAMTTMMARMTVARGVIRATPAMRAIPASHAPSTPTAVGAARRRRVPCRVAPAPTWWIPAIPAPAAQT